jgi:hypothetical protein
MKKYYWILWLGLIIWSVAYNIFITTNSTYLDAFFANELDGFSSAIFNVMGYFPLLFILDGFLYHRIKHYQWLLLTAFVLGGFLVFPVYIFGQPKKEVTTSKNRLSRILVSSIFTAFSAFFLWTLISTMGNTVYFDQFFTDVFIGIMTVDFLVLYGLSILRSRDYSTRWGWLSVIPLFGFSLAYLLEINFPSTR